MKLKLTYVMAFITGLYLPIVIGISPQILDASFVVWIWMLLSGLFAKLFMQSFAVPFMNKQSYSHISDKINRRLSIFRKLIFLTGIGFLIGESMMYGAVGTFSIGLLIYALGVHIGMNHLSKSRYFFNQ